MGYASTSGGGTSGWYCTTGFTLRYLGYDAEALRQTLATAKASAEEALAKAVLGGDIAALNDAVATAAVLLESEAPSANALTDAVAALETAIANVAVSQEAMAAFEKKTDEAGTLKDGLTSEAAKAALQALLDAVRKTRLPGDDADYTFAIRSADVETFGADGLPLGWELSLTNGDAKVKNGGHYSGNTANHYFDSYNALVGWMWYTGHQTINGIPNGTYTLQCMARTDGEGAFVTATADGVFFKEEIVKYGTAGDDGGPVWEQAAEGSAEKLANGGKGTIRVVSDKPYRIYDLGGRLLSGSTGLSAGVYIVECDGQTRKVMVE